MNMENYKPLTDVCALYKRNVDGVGGDAILKTNYNNSYQGLWKEIRTQSDKVCIELQGMEESETMDLLKSMILHFVRTSRCEKEMKQKYPLCAEAMRNIGYVAMTKLGTCSQIAPNKSFVRTNAIASLLHECAEACGGLSVLQEQYKFFGKNLTSILHGNAKYMALVFFATGYPFEESDAALRQTFGENIWALMGQTPQIIKQAEQVLDTSFNSIEYLETLSNSALSPRVQYELYTPYWLSKTSFKGGRFYNSLIDMMWEPKERVWISDIRDDNGRVIWHSSRVEPNYASFCLMNPPVWDMNVEMLQKELHLLQKTA